MAKERTILALSSVTHVFIDSFTIGLAIVLAEVFGKRQEYSSVGIVLACFTLATAVAEPMWGRISDSTGRRGLIVGTGLLLSGLFFSSIALYGLVPLPPILYLSAASFLTGLSAGTYHSVATTLLNESVGSGKRGLYQGINNAGGSLGRTLAPVALAFLISKVSFYAAFLPYLVAGTAVAAASLFMYPPDPPRLRGASGRKDPAALFDRFTVLLMAISFLRTAFFLTTMNFLPSFLVGYKGFDSLKAGYVMTLVLATGIVAQPIGGKLSDRGDRALTMAVMLFFTGASFCVFLFTPFALSVAALSLSFFSLLMTFPILFAVIGDEVPRERMGYVTGLISGAGGFSATLLQLGAGYLSEALSPRTVMLALSLFPVMSGVAALMARGEGFKPSCRE